MLLSAAHLEAYVRCRFDSHPSYVTVLFIFSAEVILVFHFVQHGCLLLQGEGGGKEEKAGGEEREAEKTSGRREGSHGSMHNTL